METLSTCSSSSSELRIILLGPKNSGKSSAGNTILCEKVFDSKMTAQCVDKCEASGRKVTIIDTPGWWGTLPYEENPKLYKQEVVWSFTLCAPGPHVLLLVLNGNTPFDEKERDVLYDNMRCFGEEVWRHTMVLFTCFDPPGAETAEQFIEDKSEILQWLLGKCENRYHVLNIKNRGDGSQVTKLLNKIQKMVEENKDGHYEIHRETLQCLEEERRMQEKRAEERRVTTQKKTTGKKEDLTELRIVLLGYNTSGKSSAGNTILGNSAFDSKRSITSVIREGDVAGRHITVVDTPGRRRNFCSQYTPRLYKDEIMLSSSLCPPGPHVFLLVIRVDVAFTEVYRRAVEEHVAFHGVDIWDHMIVLFTFGDWLVDKSIELFIESEGNALQWIVEKCGNRYHVFNNQDKDDANQVIELFEKIEEMVGRKEGCRYEMSTEKLQEVKERRVIAEERVKQRIKDQVQKRNEARHLMSEHFKMGLVLFGPVCSGKILTGNTILGREVFVKSQSEQHLKESGEVAGRALTVVYTPGFKKDFEKALEDDKHNILRSVRECSPGTHAFILTLCIDCSFAEEEKSRIEKIMEPLCESVWNHTLILFTDKDQLGDTPIELFIASEGEALQRFIEKCGNRYHVLNIKNRGDGSQVTELLEKIEEMMAQNRGRHYELDQQTLEAVERSMTVPIRRTWSMDDPVYFAKECSPSSGIGSELMAQQQKDSQTEHHSDVSQTSKKSSGVESLGSIPQFDDFNFFD